MFISPRTIRSPCGPEIVKICLKASSQTKTKPSLFHLFLLAGSEIVLNVEGFPDFLGSLSLEWLCEGEFSKGVDTNQGVYVLRRLTKSAKVG